MNVQKTLSIICKRKPIEEENMNLQNESRNKRQTVNIQKNECRLQKEEILLKENQGQLSSFLITVCKL